MKRDKATPKRSSIAKKYGVGIVLLAVLLLVEFGISFFLSSYQTRLYEQMVEELVNLNELFSNVEEANTSMNEYYLFFQQSSLESYYAANEGIQNTVEQIRGDMEGSGRYSRDVVDLCHLATTFWQDSTAFVDELNEYTQQGAVYTDVAPLSEEFANLQQTIGFINQSFRNVYTQKLEDVKQEEARLQTLSNILMGVKLGLLVLALLLVLAFSQSLLRSVVVNLNKLTRFALDIKDSDKKLYPKHIEITTNDEVSVFADAFNDMLDTIHAQIKQIEDDSQMREQLREVELENLRMSSALHSSQLKLLQSRINPHFLFNTLNMISQMARVEQVNEIAVLMEAVAEFLRYSLRNLNTPVTIQDEVDNVRNYTYIQECRYGSRIRFSYEADKEAGKQKIPSLVLQPLVENAATHGVGAMLQGGHITVRTYTQGQSAVLEVKDNGAGIPPEKLDELQKAIQSEAANSEHIGLSNVYSRLCLFFEQKVDFRIESVPGRTVVKITLPPQGGVVGGGA